LAKTAGIITQRGIVVNRYLETSVKEIYALGDCAEVEGHVLPYITPLLNCARALAKTLAGVNTAVDYPAMPVVVKTPAHPLVICPPPRGMPGAWSIENNDNNVKALFYDEKNQIQGFVLTNEAVKERMALAKQVPALF
jgi:rubredoxin-NAD+ reductase